MHRAVRPAPLAGLARFGDEEGSATVTAAGIIAAVVVLAVSVAALVAAVADSHRAQVAAELAAVAAATAHYRGADACAAAASTTRLNGAELERCTLDDADLVVAVTRARARAVARAGAI